MLLVRRSHAEIVASARQSGLDVIVGPTALSGWTAVHAYGPVAMSLSDVHGPAIHLGDEDDSFRIAIRVSVIGTEHNVPWDSDGSQGPIPRLLAEMLEAPASSREIATWLRTEHLDDVHAAMSLGEI